MRCKLVWTEQVEDYIKAKAPAPRQQLWREIKALADWNGREDAPRIRHLEDELTGYSRLRVRGDRVIFWQRHKAGQRVIECIYAGPRSTVYETFQEIFLDELAS